jgi:hypothetical protein
MGISKNSSENNLQGLSSAGNMALKFLKGHDASCPDLSSLTPAMSGQGSPAIAIAQRSSSVRFYALSNICCCHLSSSLATSQ